MPGILSIAVVEGKKGVSLVLILIILVIVYRSVDYKESVDKLRDVKVYIVHINYALYAWHCLSVGRSFLPDHLKRAANMKKQGCPSLEEFFRSKRSIL